MDSEDIDLTPTATSDLVDQLRAADTPEDVRDAVWSELGDRQDPRSHAPLAAVLLDVSLPTEIRDAAGAALSRMGYGEFHTPAQVRAWWHADDPVLAEYAVRVASEDLSDLLIARTADVGHPLREDAVIRTGIECSRPDAMRALVRCGADPDPDIRREALEGLTLNNVAAALDVALACVGDSDEDLADQAAYTLGRQECPRAVRALCEAAEDPRDAVRETARAQLDFIRQQVVDFTRDGPEARRHVEDWFRRDTGTSGAEKRAWELLDLGAVTPREAERASAPELAALDTRTLLAALDEPLDEPLRGWLLTGPPWHLDHWSGVAEADRDRVASALATHFDPRVRAFGTEVLAAWNDREQLLALVEDPCSIVRHAAVSDLAELSEPDAEIAELARGWLTAPSEIWMRGQGAVWTLEAHGKPREIRSLLVDIARSEEDADSTRDAAVCSIERVGTRRELQALETILDRPPVVGWMVHVAVLVAFINRDRRPGNLDAVRDAEDLCLQANLQLLLA